MLMEEGSIVHPEPKHRNTQHPEHDHDNVPRSKSCFYLAGLNRSRITRWRRNQQLHVFHMDVSAPHINHNMCHFIFGGCRYAFSQCSRRLILSFPHASTTKWHPPQLVHKERTFLYCPTP